jgi:hypothetical protein
VVHGRSADGRDPANRRRRRPRVVDADDVRRRAGLGARCDEDRRAIEGADAYPTSFSRWTSCASESATPARNSSGRPKMRGMGRCSPESFASIIRPYLIQSIVTAIRPTPTMTASPMAIPRPQGVWIQSARRRENRGAGRRAGGVRRRAAREEGRPATSKSVRQKDRGGTD